MNKALVRKILLISLAVCAFVGGVLALFYAPESRYSPLERLKLRRLMSELIYTELDETGAPLQVPCVAAMPGTDGSDANTYLGTKAQFNTGAEYVFVNVAFDSDGVPVIAESFDDVSETPVKFSRILDLLERFPKVTLCVNLCELSNIMQLYSDIVTREYENRVIICGADKNSVNIITEKITAIDLIYSIDDEDPNRAKLEALKQQRIRGICVDYDQASRELSRLCTEIGIELWVKADDNFTALCKLATFQPDFFLTTKPTLTSEILHSWSPEFAQDYFTYN